MTTIAKVLKVLPALGLLGCVSDFSPDPRKDFPYVLGESDGGAKADAGSSTKPDAKVTPPKDSGGGPSNMDDTDAAADESDEKPPVDAGPKAGPCDLTGRWIMTERMISSAFSATQVTTAWHYVEISQTGDDAVMTKTLFCGGQTQQAPGDAFEVTMNDMGAWPGYQKFSNYNGRKGTSRSTGGGCEVTWEEDALIRGATTPYYKDKSHPLPEKLADEATADKPGWEDWDEDGRAGITMIASGLASGKMFTSVRTFNSSTGMADENADTLLLTLNWEQQRKVIEFEPATAFVLVSDASRANQPGQNVVEFGRLGDSDATGDDDAKCEAVRSLYSTLTPRGSNVKDKL